MPYLRLPSLQPPGPVTGHRNSRCYLCATANCSSTISSEHYVSAALLRKIDKVIEVSGTPWLADGEVLRAQVSSLVANVLCDRHNAALSALDAAAAGCFQCIQDGGRHALARSLSSKTSYTLISGEAFELWGIKCLLGMYSGKILAAGRNRPLRGEYSFDIRRCVDWLAKQNVDIPFGLYVHASTEDPGVPIAIMPLLVDETMSVHGLRVALSGIYFDFVVDGRGRPSGFFIEQTFYRPDIIDINGPKRTARLFLSWPSATKEVRHVGISVDGWNLRGQPVRPSEWG